MTVSAPTTSPSHLTSEVKKYDSPQPPASQFESSKTGSASLGNANANFFSSVAPKSDATSAALDSVTISSAAQAASRQPNPFSTPQAQPAGK